MNRTCATSSGHQARFRSRTKPFRFWVFFMNNHNFDFINNLTCWYVTCGGSPGSVFRICLGAMIPRAKPLSNPKLSDQFRSNAPEYSIMAYCAWRLDSPAGVITGWLDPNEEDGPLVKGLDSLVGEKITRVELISPGWDLMLNFTGDKALRIFCDATNFTFRSTNWLIYGTEFYIECERGNIEKGSM